MKNKKTDMDQVRSAAKAFLYLEIQTTKFSPIIISHPFFDTGITAIKGENDLRIVNIVESEADLRLARKVKEQIIDEAESVLNIATHITKPYKLTFLKYVKQYLSAKDIGLYLASSWCLIENVSRDVNVSKREIVNLFRSADKKTLLSNEEKETLASMDESIEIYRGITDNSYHSITGTSWTLNIKTARYFANRFNKGGYIYKGHIDKEHILAYFEGRSEEEIVVDYRCLYHFKQIEEIRPNGEIIQISI